MTPAAVNWIPGVGSLALGLALGGFLAWRLRRAAAATTAGGGSALAAGVADLAEREATLLAQLEELEDTATKYSVENLVSSRDALELEAAQTLRALDERLAAARRLEAPGAPAGVAESAAAGGRRPAPALAWGLGVTVTAALLLAFVERSTTPREPGAGRAPVAVAEGGTAGEAALRARVAVHPEDDAARLELARLDLGAGDLGGAQTQIGAVLERSPTHPQALAYDGLLRFASGHGDDAIARLQRAMAANPDVVEPYAILGLVYARTGHLAQARATMEAAERRFPERRAQLEQMLTQLGEGPSEGAPAAGPPDEAAPASGPRRGAIPGTAAAPRTGGLAGRVELAANAGTPPASAVLFVIVRAAGVSSGPPAAVKRLAPSAFPLRFAIGDADSMLGAPLPPRVRIEARLDSDGDPLTRSDRDLRAVVDDIPLGTTDLVLVLRR